MNVKRFSARTSREALALVREQLGEDAVVLSTKPSAEGVEVLAMAPEGLQQAQAAAAAAPAARAPRAEAEPRRPLSLAERIAARGERLFDRGERHEPSLPPAAEPVSAATAALRREPAAFAAAAPAAHAGHAGPGYAGADPEVDPDVARDVETLGRSALTFQDYVRERMLRRRQAELEQQSPRHLPEALQPEEPLTPPAGAAALRVVAGRRAEPRFDEPEAPAPMNGALRAMAARVPPLRAPNYPVLRDEVAADAAALRGRAGAAGLLDGSDEGTGLADALDGDELPVPPRGARRLSVVPGRAAPGGEEMLGELRQVRQLIEERFGMLAFMERMQKDPRQVGMFQQLIDAGFSPGLVRKLVLALPDEQGDPLGWAAHVLERNLLATDPENPQEPALEDHQGVLALIGPTGVGKTTGTAKIAAAFAAKYGAANLGLITLDAYRVAAHEQLRTYGRILGVPVHTAHDRSSLEDLLDLLAAKRLVLIDTAGVAQRDARTRELLEMLQHRAIEKVLVVNGAAQGETTEDVLAAYGVSSCRGVILSKLDEAVKLAPALDALIRARARVLGVASGQRVPEDWHRLSAHALVQRAIKGVGSANWRLDANEVSLVFAATQGGTLPQPGRARPVAAAAGVAPMAAPMAAPTAAPSSTALHAPVHNPVHNPVVAASVATPAGAPMAQQMAQQMAAQMAAQMSAPMSAPMAAPASPAIAAQPAPGLAPAMAGTLAGAPAAAHAAVPPTSPAPSLASRLGLGGGMPLFHKSGAGRNAGLPA